MVEAVVFDHLQLDIPLLQRGVDLEEVAEVEGGRDVLDLGDVVVLQKILLDLLLHTLVTVVIEGHHAANEREIGLSDSIRVDLLCRSLKALAASTDQASEEDDEADAPDAEAIEDFIDRLLKILELNSDRPRPEAKIRVVLVVLNLVKVSDEPESPPEE